MGEKGIRMYLPKAFALDDPAAIARLLRENAFALLITADSEAGIQASHLPLRVEFDSASRPLRVFGHLARANPQAAALRAAAEAKAEALAIFSGPHAYVSPSHYQPGPAVPTWNYLSVQVRGRLQTIETPEAVLADLGQLVADYEDSRPVPWRLEGQEPEFLGRQLRGILAFELVEPRVAAKAKLSQNRPAGDREAVARAMQTEEPALAAWMEALGLSSQP